MDYHRYMDEMDMNVLSDMPNIKKKARRKLFKQQACTITFPFPFPLLPLFPFHVWQMIFSCMAETCIFIESVDKGHENFHFLFHKAKWSLYQ